MQFLWMLSIGLVIGVVVKLLVTGRDREDLVTTILVGIGGSLLAGYIGQGLGWYQSPFERNGLVGSIVGAMAIIFIYRLVTGLRRNPL